MGLIAAKRDLEYALHHSGWLHQHCRLGTQTQVAAEEQVQIAGEQGSLFWQDTGTLYTAGGLLLQGRWNADSGYSRMGCKRIEPRGPNWDFRTILVCWRSLDSGGPVC